MMQDLCVRVLVLAESNIISSMSKCDINIISANILYLFVVFCSLKHVSKNKLLPLSPFVCISTSTWKEKNLEVLTWFLFFCFVWFCFVWKTIYLDEMKVIFTLALKGFRVYKLVSFMCVLSKVFFPRTHPSGNPSYAISFP